jgi:hypothetical protein
MTERLKLSVKGVWLIVSTSAVVLPIVLPSMRDASFANSPIAIATLSLFILSFPSSLLALIASSFVSYLLEIDPWSMGAKYMHVVWLFALGVVQWFWIAPKIFQINRLFERLEMRESAAEPSLVEAKADINAGPLQFGETTPIERVMTDESVPRSEKE